MKKSRMLELVVSFISSWIVIFLFSKITDILIKINTLLGIEERHYARTENFVFAFLVGVVTIFIFWIIQLPKNF